MTKAQKASKIKRHFLLHYGDAKTELRYANLYELLVSVMLSAQCTDRRVNLITPALFKRFPSIESLSNASLDEVKSFIQSCSFFNNKATNLIKMANQVMKDFGGQIPSTQEELKSLAGVGQKTANVVLIEYFEGNFMAVDTHVFRVSHRLGLTSAKTPQKTEEDLVKLFKSDLHALHQGFVLFGRYICKAIKPSCDECFVREFCKTKQNKTLKYSLGIKMDLVIQGFIEVIQVIADTTPLRIKDATTNNSCSNISIQNQEYYFFYNQDFINLLSQALLGIDTPPSETIKDIAQEFSNLIIGKTKVLYANPNINIGLPKFLQCEEIPPNLKEVAHFQIKNGKCSIYKEQ